MSEAFKSHYPQRVDSKFRVMIPKEFRAVLEANDKVRSENGRPRVAIVYGGEDRPYLECYTIKGKQRLEKRIKKMGDSGDDCEVVTYNFITMSHEADFDTEGRFVVPPPARGKLRLDVNKDGVDTVFSGNLETFRIWHRDDWEAEQARQKRLVSMLLPAGRDIKSLIPPADPDDEDED
jgi:MraZ protein